MNSGNGSFLCTFLPEKPQTAQKIQSRPNKTSKGQQRPIKAYQGHERPKQQKCVFSSIIYLIQAGKGIIMPKKVLFKILNFHETCITNRTAHLFRG